MISTEQVKTLLQTYLTDPDEEYDALLSALSEDCARRARTLAGERELSEEETSLLVHWAAAEALYQFLLVQQALSPEKLTADGVSITMGGAEQARAFADEKYRAVTAALGEGAFYFAGI